MHVCNYKKYVENTKLLALCVGVGTRTWTDLGTPVPLKPYANITISGGVSVRDSYLCKTTNSCVCVIQQIPDGPTKSVGLSVKKKDAESLILRLNSSIDTVMNIFPSFLFLLLPSVSVGE